MDVNILAVIIGLAILVIGPGSGVWVGIRAGMKELRDDAGRDHTVLIEIRDQLRVLNGRVGDSERLIAGLEDREDEREESL